MTDPYVVLGVPRTASDDEIKKAYRNLAKKYHPDNYSTTPDIADVAAEKMREVNEAYDIIVKERKNGDRSSASDSGTSNASSSYGSGASAYSAKSSGTHESTGKAQNSNSDFRASDNPYSTTTKFEDVRRLIMDKRFDDANAVLDGTPADRRDAEWNFLKGAVLYNRGWLEQANTYLTAAVNMDPGNYEFRAAYDQTQKMRSGSSGGYKVGKGGGGCGDPCNLCCSLLCADQCCECCGGDLISCC